MSELPGSVPPGVSGLRASGCIAAEGRKDKNNGLKERFLRPPPGRPRHPSQLLPRTPDGGAPVKAVVVLPLAALRTTLGTGHASPFFLLGALRQRVAGDGRESEASECRSKNQLHSCSFP